ncbi:MAG: hypothetical protein NZ551_10645 [Microscillaceae bacterium]|nr:hypothetical protein [Microscillaceae bacterium]MDW8461655.1 hypothetical protein [Cytophagales bacterium]
MPIHYEKPLSSEEEKQILEQFFQEVRTLLEPYTSERKIIFSNSQLFAILMIAPITMAMATDDSLDFAETNILIEIASFFERNELSPLFNQFSQPEKVLSDSEFKKIIYNEMQYMCLSMRQYEPIFIKALKKLLAVDKHLSQMQNIEGSIAKRILENLSGVIYNNTGDDKIEEAKVRRIIQELDLGSYLNIRI